MARPVLTLALAGTLLVGALDAPLAAQSASPRPAPADPEGWDRGRARGAPEGSAEADVFRETFRAIRDYSLASVNDSTLWEQALAGMLEALDDPYARVMTPKEVNSFREETTGNYGGIGVQITTLNESVTVTAVFRGTPADEAGILEGDRIVRVDDAEAEEWTASDAADRIRGQIGTTVDVYVRRDGFDEPILHRIERGEVHLSAVTAAELPGGIGYIGLDRVARHSAVELDSALAVLEDARGIVFDLRRNPGGYLDEALSLADLFLEKGDVIASTRSRGPGRSGKLIEESGYARRPAQVPEKPIVILVDRYTASAAEIISGALQDHDRAVVLGERTFGKGVVQTILPLPAGRQLALTTGEWYTPLGRSLHRPRDRAGRPLPEDPDTFPVFRSESGRPLQGGGGVFPDIEIADDTLMLAERELVNAANEAGISLPLRIAEFAFAAAQAARDGRGATDVTETAFAGFMDALAADGLPPESAANPEARDYLLWRVRIALAQRLNDEEHVLEYRMERDPVLAEAVRLVRAAPTQALLLELTDRERPRYGVPGEEHSLRR